MLNINLWTDTTCPETTTVLVKQSKVTLLADTYVFQLVAYKLLKFAYKLLKLAYKLSKNLLINY